MPFLSTVIRQIGLLGCVTLGLLGYYEGIPFIRDIPLIGSIPLIGEIAMGRVETVASRARADAKQGYVLEVEKLAAEATAQEMQRQAVAAAQTLEEHRRRLASAQLEERALAAKLELEISQHEKELDAAGRACRLDKSDLDWVRHH